MMRHHGEYPVRRLPHALGTAAAFNSSSIYADVRRSYEFVNSTEYETPTFPSLYWPPHEPTYALHYIGDVWRFTLIWTFIIYAIFHVGAALIALLMQVGKRPSAWKYLWTIPLLYVLAAGIEALLAGSIVGVVSGAPPFSPKRSKVLTQ